MLWSSTGRPTTTNLVARPGCPRTTDQGDLPTRIRYGYRRIHIVLRREGWTIYRELGLQLRIKPPKRTLPVTAALR
jgi:hypothetical protein